MWICELGGLLGRWICGCRQLIWRHMKSWTQVCGVPGPEDLFSSRVQEPVGLRMVGCQLCEPDLSIVIALKEFRMQRQ